MNTHHLSTHLLSTAINILISFTLLSYIVYYYTYISINQNLIRHDNVYNLIKVVLLVALAVSYITYILFLHYFHTHFLFLGNYHLFGIYKITPPLRTNTIMPVFDLSADYFGIILVLLGYFVGTLSLLTLDNRIFWKNIRYLFCINAFLIVVYFYAFSANLLLFFLFYELLLIPSFLVVYFISPSRRAIQASLYFLIWTQIGSFLVLISIAYIISVVGSSHFNDIRAYNFTYTESYFVQLLLFLGFGFKAPLWPFHYWLTKTHVEAPAGFSMYLSGFLVKSAVYGFYKLSGLLGNDTSTTLCNTICIVGVIDASLKMWGQTDLKKLVAYGTIQEMNLILLTFCWGDTNAILGGILFSATHSCLSTLMFFIVDCIQRRFNSRSVVEISGIIQVTPTLGIVNILMVILYAGLPGTLKFSSEFYVFCGLFEVTPTLTLLIFFISNVLGLIGFSKSWFGVTFGMNLKDQRSAPFDLNFKELYIIFMSIIFLLVFTFFTNLFF